MSKSLLEAFRTECEEHLRDLERGLVNLESRPHDEELIHTLFRAAHTIKGNGAVVGEQHLVHFAHVVESLLHCVRERSLDVSSALVSDLLLATDVLSEMVAVIANGGQAKSVDERGASAKLAVWTRKSLGAATEGACGAAPTVTRNWRIFRVKLAPSPAFLHRGQDPLLVLDELERHGEIIECQVNTSRLPALQELDPFLSYLQWSVLLGTEASIAEIRDLLDTASLSADISVDEVVARRPETAPDETASVGQASTIEGAVRARQLHTSEATKTVGSEPNLAALPRLAAPNACVAVEQGSGRLSFRAQRRGSSVRVATSKLDALLNLVGELVIAAAQASRVARSDSAAPETRRAVAEGLERITRDLQEQVMGARMVPIDELFSGLQRLVRDLATDLGKSAELLTSGNETELDKTVVQQLSDPLKHMLRNAIDHGLETVEERVALGKPATGRIRLEAEQREGTIIIRVSDDGRGVSVERVLARARARGIVPPSGTLSERQVFELLFRPGFSTADAVTDVSGRGVGLDIVKRNIDSIHGTVFVESKPGVGTTFELHLPLTLAIIDGLAVMAGTQRLIFPLSSIVELTTPAPGDILHLDDEHETVHVRGVHLPLVRLEHVFGSGPVRTTGGGQLLLVLEVNGKRFGTFVDAAVGIEQAVIKSLDSSFQLFRHLGSHSGRPRGIAGATILSDGSVSLIVDVFSLEHAVLCEGDEPSQPRTDPSLPDVPRARAGVPEGVAQ